MGRFRYDRAVGDPAGVLMEDRSCYSTSLIADLARDTRAVTLALVGDLSDEQWMGLKLPIVNPLLWEVGHVGWFQEHWVIRHLRRKDPILTNGDALYDSSAVAHNTRWDLPLPDRAQTLRFIEQVLSRAIEGLPDGYLTEDEFYFNMLAIQHEAMHAEAFAYTRQTLGYPAPKIPASIVGAGSDLGGSARSEATADPEGNARIRGDAVVPGGTYRIGATRDLPFVFDNEKWAHEVSLPPFRIARTAVSNAEFAAFVDDGGYERDEWWSRAGLEWRTANHAGHPVYWKRESGGRWLERAFDRWAPLRDNLPVLHVNFYEAEAYCAWAHRRLPTEAEWEIAASMAPGGTQGARRLHPWGDSPSTPERANLDWVRCGRVEVDALPSGDSAPGCRQMMGNAWEWTSSDFQPYPGFVADPYRDYSQPWFGSHKVLRGGCWATRSYLIRNTWRNFYTPDRRDVWAGFRTCAKRRDE